MRVGSPLVGAAAAVAGYRAAFYVAAVAALMCAALSVAMAREGAAEPIPEIV
jgi:predicted MFS family arabinose efflux permease